MSERREGNDTQGRESAWEVANNIQKRVKYYDGRKCAAQSTLGEEEEGSTDGRKPG